MEVPTHNIRVFNMNKIPTRFILQFRLLLASLLGSFVTTSISLSLIAFSLFTFYISYLYPNPFSIVFAIYLIYSSIYTMAIYHPRLALNNFMVKVDLNAHPSFKQLLQSLCIKLNTPMITDVYINDKLNAAISQVKSNTLIGAKKLI